MNQDNSDFFTIFERTVIQVYNAGILNAEMLDAMASVYKGYKMPLVVRERAIDGCTLDEIVAGIILGTVEDTWGEFVKICRDRWGWL